QPKKTPFFPPSARANRLGSFLLLPMFLAGGSGVVRVFPLRLRAVCVQIRHETFGKAFSCVCGFALDRFPRHARRSSRQYGSNQKRNLRTAWVFQDACLGQTLVCAYSYSIPD